VNLARYPRKEAKKIIKGTPLEDVSRKLVREWRTYREPRHTMVSILRYTNPAPRYGEGKPSHPELTQLIASGRTRYAALLDRFSDLREDYSRISWSHKDDRQAPHWNNGWIPCLDGIALYCTLAIANPAVYLEVGSGNSTKFARRSIRDHGLRTQIISIDPYPRAECEALCDEVFRSPLESVDVAKAMSTLSSGDIVFLDGSHRSFMNSDATVFFLEMMPRVPSGGLVHIHDIFLPDDYPEVWKNRYYTEQYLLATWLLGGSAGYEVHCPNHFISKDPDLNEPLKRLWTNPRMVTAYPNGPLSFWLRRT
jgi:Methyltransferase domain